MNNEDLEEKIRQAGEETRKKLMDNKTFLLKLDAETHQKLKLKSVHSRISMQELVIHIIQDALQ